MDQELFNIGPLRRVLLQASVYKGFKLFAPASSGQSGRRLVQNEPDYFHVRVLRQRRVPHRNLNRCDAQ